MTKRILLIDADVVAYQCSSALESAVEWENGYWTWNVNFMEVINRVDEVVEDMVEKLEADDYKLCLTDPYANFRLDVLPTYKTHRSTVRKPLVLLAVKEWLVDNRGAIMRPGLEGDDVMGILSTWKGLKGEKIIVSIDKDMMTIPGLYVRTKAIVSENGAETVGAYEIQEITKAEADRYHMMQTLSGDVTDGYVGCPGVGKDTATKIVEQGLMKTCYEHTLKSGPRKGQTEFRYSSEHTDDLWEAVVSHFNAAGLKEEDALQQARVARILRASDYDFKNKKVKLWTPTM